MKEIKAIIQPHRLDQVRDALLALPAFPGMSVSRAEGCSANDGTPRNRTWGAELTDFSPKVRIEMIAPDELADEIVRIIYDHTHTGRQGDGIVWVTEVVGFWRIKGERPG